MYNHTQWAQTLGQRDLYELLRSSREGMDRAGYRELLNYHYTHATFAGNPSYELVVKYGRMEIFAAVYVIDHRFRKKIRPEERDRIQNLLASRAIGNIAACGVLALIALAENEENVESVTYEARDKSFLCLQ